MEVHDIDETVQIGDKMTGIITGICIRSGYNVTYEVAWWDGRQRKCEWLQSHEVESKKKRYPLKIGFGNG